MNCPLCGKAYPCVHNRRAENINFQSAHFDPSISEDSAVPTPAGSPYGTISVAVCASPVEEPGENNAIWRDQVASRVQQHRARRKNTDPDPNMELRFPVQEAPIDPRIMRARRFVAQAATRSPFADDLPLTSYAADSAAVAPSNRATRLEVPAMDEAGIEDVNKVIRFPQSGKSKGVSREAMADIHEYYAAMEELEAELDAMPQLESLRITDVGPEIAQDEMAEPYPAIDCALVEEPPIAYRREKGPPAEQLELPNFDDIQLEATHHAVLPDLELGPRPAALGQRMMAGVVDGVIVLAAAAVFNVTFTQLAEEHPHSRMALLCALAVASVLWTLYQYTFLVHGSGTPGMHLAQLELANFDGKPVSAFNRRCRAVASALSGFSLGLGFLWALVDEDQLGWHDRMTKTMVKTAASPPVLSH